VQILAASHPPTALFQGVVAVPPPGIVNIHAGDRDMGRKERKKRRVLIFILIRRAHRLEKRRKRRRRIMLLVGRLERRKTVEKVERAGRVERKSRKLSSRRERLIILSLLCSMLRRERYPNRELR